MSDCARFGIRRIPSNSLYSFFGRVPRDAGKDDTCRLHLNHEQDAIGDQASPSQYLDCKEVHPRQNRHMRSDEVLPTGLTPLRSRCDSMPSENVSDRVISVQSKMSLR